MATVALERTEVVRIQFPATDGRIGDLQVSRDSISVR